MYGRTTYFCGEMYILSRWYQNNHKCTFFMDKGGGPRMVTFSSYLVARVLQFGSSYLLQNSIELNYCCN